MLRYDALFPIMSIIISFCSALGYLLSKDYGRMVYWLSATILTTSITFWVK